MILERAALRILLGCTLALNVFASGRAQADADDPPYRVARVAFIQGSASFQPAGTEEWVAVDTPNLAFTVLRPGLYRIGVDESANSTSIIVRSGQGEATGGGSAYTLNAGDYDIFSGTDQLAADARPGVPAEDALDIWSAERDRRRDRSLSARYVPDTIGYEDLDEYGSWRTTEYGSAWYPSGVAADWAPYRTGHWSYIEPWGYTWVGDQPWGFAPPPPAPPFEVRQEAIKKNGGKPLSIAQIRRMAPAAPPARTAAIRMAPPASPVNVAKLPGRPAPLTTEPPKVNRPPPSLQVSRPAPAAIHPKDLPAAPRPPSPSIANSVLDREHLQQQAQLRAQQDEERLRIQRLQELQHQQLAKQLADEARRQELERQHRLQTQQLQQRHIQAQQQLAARQEEQRRAVAPGQQRRPP